jgi:hypothetical protein
MRAAWYRKQTVVPFGRAFIFLPDLENADDAAGQQKTREGRRVVNDHNIERIAVFGRSRRDKTPVVGIGQTDQKRLCEREGFQFWVEGEFCAAYALAGGDPRIFDLDLLELMPPLAALCPPATVIDKTRYSGFAEPSLPCASARAGS